MRHSALASVRPDEIAHAGEIAVASVLDVQPSERFVVFCDHSSRAIAASLVAAADRRGAVTRAVFLDNLGTRPIKALPDRVIRQLSVATASAFVAKALPEELGLRQQILHFVRNNALRHAHMPNISANAFARGNRIDYAKVAAFGQRLLGKLSAATHVEVTSPGGTQLLIALSDCPTWFTQFGTLAPGRWGNLPAGALYASPARVDGVFVADACLGEYFGERAGLLAPRPVTFFIQAGRVRAVTAPGRPKLQADVERMLAVAPGSERVGLIALGTNYGITTATGEALIDQNLPGLHLGIGDPAARVTGADWSAPTSFAACQSASTVHADGIPLIVRGKLLTTV